MNSRLNFVVPYPSWKYSFSPIDSDRLPNFAILSQVIGTLVKFSPSGRYEPYLASGWSISEDGRVWKFKLRSGLVADDGYPINAPNYVECLKKLLKLYARFSSPLSFEFIEGWSAFKDGNEKQFGIIATSELELEFRFVQKLEVDGVLNDLDMVYFGFYSPEDFASGGWKQKTTVTSTGAYRVLSSQADHVILQKRDGWFSLRKNAPDEVGVYFRSFEDALTLPNHSLILFKRIDGSESVPSYLEIMKGVPTTLTSIVLSLKKAGPFNTNNNRALFMRTLLEMKASLPRPQTVSDATNSFYPDHPTKYLPNPDATEFKPPKAPIKVMLHSSMPKNEEIYAQNLFSEACKKLSCKVEFFQEPTDVHNLLRDEAFDVRVPRVDIGGTLIGAAIRMMFCTSMGVSFPDPSLRICRLTKEFELEGSKITKEQYGDEFNRILAEDAAVLPLFHSGVTWMFTKDIDSSGITPAMILPRFDWVELR